MTFDPKVLLQAVYGFAAEYSEDKSTQNAAFIIQPSVDLVHFSIEKSGDPEIDDELRPEYDLSELDGGIRGKYHGCGSCELVSKGLNNIPCGLSRCISPRLERPLKYKYTEHAERDAIYRDKCVVIEYSIDSEKAEYIISDEGEGFDYNKVFNDDPIKSAEEFVLHGRGITIAKNFFDSLEYSENGSRVVMTKYFNKND